MTASGTIVVVIGGGMGFMTQRHDYGTSGGAFSSLLNSLVEPEDSLNLLSWQTFCRPASGSTKLLSKELNAPR